MVSLSMPKSLPLSTHHHHRHKHLFSSSFTVQQPLLILVSSITNSKSSIFKPISASSNPPSPIIPSSSASASPQPQNLYQPFRPPPSPLPPQYRNLDTAGRIDILSNRLGLWFQYAPLISALSQEGFTPPSIEELTGISGVEQNRLVVATKVRESLLESPQLDPDALSYFDNGGAELLYEIRLLSATQRAAAACYLVENRLDAKGARDVARSIKDFPLRRGDPGWESFDYTLPGDCLSFMYFRQSGEQKNPSGKRTAALELALEVAGSEKAKKRVLKELEDKGEGTKVEEEFDDIRVPVVRMKTGEVAEASKVVVLPVCREEEKEDGVSRAPFECGSEGDFGIVASDKVWDRWVVLPGWEPVVGLGGKGGVVVSFGDARALPWKVNRWYKEEPILVVADRGRKEVTMNHGFYLVMMCDDNGGAGGSLKVERGSALKDKGVKESLGTVVLVVRPPKEEIEDQLSDDDWE